MVWHPLDKELTGRFRRLQKASGACRRNSPSGGFRRRRKVWLPNASKGDDDSTRIVCKRPSRLWRSSRRRDSLTESCRASGHVEPLGFPSLAKSCDCLSRLASRAFLDITGLYRTTESLQGLCGALRPLPDPSGALRSLPDCCGAFRSVAEPCRTLRSHHRTCRSSQICSAAASIKCRQPVCIASVHRGDE